MKCIVYPGVIVHKHEGSVGVLWLREWDLVEARSLVVMNVPASWHDEQFRSLLKDLSADPGQSQSFETSSIQIKRMKVLDEGETATAYVEMPTLEMSRNALRKSTGERNLFGAPGCHCFPNRRVHLRVLSTDLYPRVSELAGKSPFNSILKLEIKNHAFVIESRKRQDLQALFLSQLAEERVLESECLDPHTSDLSAVQLQLWADATNAKITSKCGPVKTTIKKLPHLHFQIDGEAHPRAAAKEDLQTKMFAFITNSRYREEHPLGHGALKWLVPVGLQLLRRMHPAVSFEFENQPKHLLKLRCEKVDLGKKAFDSVCKLLSKATEVRQASGSSALRCTICRRDLKPFPRKQRGSDVGRKPADDEALQLELCGCVYCTFCLEVHIMEELAALRAHPVQCMEGGGSVADVMQGWKVHCFACGKDILPLNDCQRRLERGSFSQMFRQAFCNYLRVTSHHSGKGYEVATCLNERCRLPFLVDADPGVSIYQCAGCSQIFCIVCSKLVQNQLDFAAHRQCIEG